MRQCYNCEWEWRKPYEPAFREMCPRCDAFLHTCKNCRLYEPTAHQQCKSPTVEAVGDKERGNFCGEFRFMKTEPPPSSKNSETLDSKKEDDGLNAREKWRRLFKDD
jgi:hypothetical protein